MSKKKITMQDIADACGLSRNTVSKVLNQNESVAPATREYVLKKVEELGYRSQGKKEETEPVVSDANIALLTNRMPREYHFGVPFIPIFTNFICRAGYTVRMYEISDEELANRALPPHFTPQKIAGVIGIELFDRPYMEMICDLGIPTIFIDSYAQTNKSLMKSDFLLMENTASVLTVTEQLIQTGAKRISFVGDKDHCTSFHERWIGYCAALANAGIAVDKEICILENDASPYCDPVWLEKQLSRFDPFPDAFVCANDYLAIHLTSAIKKRGLSIPGDVSITGFDGIFQSALVEPPLTTVQIPFSDMGKTAASILLSRIENPDKSYSWTYVKTTPVWRESAFRESANKIEA